MQHFPSKGSKFSAFPETLVWRGPPPNLPELPPPLIIESDPGLWADLKDTQQSLLSQSAYRHLSPGDASPEAVAPSPQETQRHLFEYLARTAPIPDQLSPMSSVSADPSSPSASSSSSFSSSSQSSSASSATELDLLTEGPSPKTVAPATANLTREPSEESRANENQHDLDVQQLLHHLNNHRRNPRHAQYKAVRDLSPDVKYEIVAMDRTITKYGPSVRAYLVDPKSPSGMSSVFLPKTVGNISDEQIRIINALADGRKPVHLMYKGMIGKAGYVSFVLKEENEK